MTPATWALFPKSFGVLPKTGRRGVAAEGCYSERARTYITFRSWRGNEPDETRPRCASSLPGFTPHNRSYTTLLLKRHRDAAQDVFASESPQHRRFSPMNITHFTLYLRFPLTQYNDLRNISHEITYYSAPDAGVCQPGACCPSEFSARFCGGGEARSACTRAEPEYRSRSEPQLG